MVKKDKAWSETLTLILIAPPLLLAGLAALIFFAAAYPFTFTYRQWLKFRFWRRHGRHGRFVLFVYSDSPNWKAYIEANILPRLGPHVVTLNWSRRREWERINPFEAKVFKRWAGEEEFNPMALVFSPGGRVREVRFWRAFRELKHGKEGSLKRAETLLFAEVERITSRPG
ncbi:MAG TPA: hypothetical protein VF611_18560 [Pyrinomonadaceae bacterium]